MWASSSKGAESKVQPEAQVPADMEGQAMLKTQTMTETKSPMMKILGPVLRVSDLHV